MDGQTTRAVGQYAVLFDNKMQNRVVADILDGNNSIDYEATALAADALGVGTFALTDNRDNKDYLVRRLADGNCWMVQNLDLELADFVGKDNTNGGLTPANTDLADSGRAYWDPGKSAADIAYAIDNTVNKTDQTSYFPVASINYLGMTQQQQFQSADVGGVNYYWGSKCTKSGNSITCDSSATAEANELTTFPRSYNNTETDALGNITRVRYTPTNWKTGQVHDQALDSTTGYPSYAPHLYDWDVSVVMPSTSTYIPTTRASATTGGAGSAYEAVADGSYYGNIYVGHFYNWYAATAETGTYLAAAKIYDDSICPANWKLPIGTTNTSWEYLIKDTYKLITANGTQTDANAPQGAMHGPLADIQKIPISLNNPGTTPGAGVSGRAYTSDYWTSININSQIALNLRISDGNDYTYIEPRYNYYYVKNNGASVRCVSRGTENQTQPEEPIVGQCAANSICYDANGGTGAMNNTTGATFGSSKVLSAPTYTRTGYAFVGWSESKDAVQSGAYIYGPNETITVPNLSSEGMTLYAQWLAPENSSYTMQAFGRNETVKTCATMTDGNNGTAEERIALRDERDDNVYIVTKLKDGNCWMTSNLALNLADFAGKTTGTLLTPENTDLTASREDLSTLTIEGVGGEQQTIKYWDPSASTVKKYTETYASELQSRGLTQDFTGLSTLLLGQEQPAQFLSGNQNGYYQGSVISDDDLDVNLGTSHTRIASRNSQIPRARKNLRGMSYFYNFYASTAEMGTYNMSYGNVDDSICPSGWSLPTEEKTINTADKTWSKLIYTSYHLVDNDAESVKALARAPLNLSFDGYISSLGYRAGPGEVVNYATSSVDDPNSARNFYSSTVTTRLIVHNIDPKVNGLLIRCVKD